VRVLLSPAASPSSAQHRGAVVLEAVGQAGIGPVSPPGNATRLPTSGR